MKTKPWFNPQLKKKRLYLDSHSSLIIDFITTNEKQKGYKEVKSQEKHSKKVGREWKEYREIVYRDIKNSHVQKSFM